MTPTGRLFAIAGAQGSPGCSFVAIALARCLAAAGVETLLIDADAEQPALGCLLGADSADIGILTRAAEVASLTAAAVREASARVGDRLALLDIDPARAAGLSGRAVGIAARASHSAVVADLGHHPESFQRELALVADWLVWVVVPNRLGLQRAHARVGASALVAGSSGLLFNRTGRDCLPGADRELAERHGLPILGSIRRDDRVAAAAAAGPPAHRSRSLGRPIRELARTLHPQAAPVEGAWP